MNKFILGLAAAGTLASAHASAATLAAGIFASTGKVVQDNGNPNCGQVFLTKDSLNNSVIVYPGANKPGFTLYVPFAGALQLCNSYANIPAGGLNGYTSDAQCALIPAPVPAQTVNFQFTLTTTDANTGYGTTTVSIPAGNILGGGCVATIATSIVRSGK